ncbi:putative transmembrane signal transduction receptor and sigma-54 dependent response regulator [Nitrospira sp. KM1]|uniref:sigma 54-interacting transcriptional regulator n=1 Tax=Nitrospira sp. KM1 TaxID=1936990 RepID=UPI0013A73440|nr:sigma 54-interacting transcriptional regulator [Nitrospira sp. KM1]BCA56080.1 putative transmembrane signal transduction receptor and sigma-54 dependent response regulator [Nitrospira sp. KM1]
MSPDWLKLWRRFIASLPLQALAIGLLAVLLARGFWSVAPATFTSLDWSVYDGWVRNRPPIGFSPSLAIIARDAASEERFGPGPLDRSVLARLISAAQEFGAAAIGVDHRLAQGSPAQRGGAASDALLLEAIQNAAPVVFVHDSEPAFASPAALSGHVLMTAQPDHVARHVPILALVDTQTVPAFGSLLYEAYRQRATTAAAPLIGQTGSSALVNLIGNGSGVDLPVAPLSIVWDAIQEQQNSTLEALFKDNIVAILPNPVQSEPWLLPTGQSAAGMAVHLQLVNMLLTGNRLYHSGSLGQYSFTLLLASLVAWCLLRYHGPRGLVFAIGALAIYVMLTLVALSGGNVILPLALPLTAALFVFVGTTGWTHLVAGQRMLLLERDMLRLRRDEAAVREALVLRENRAEALQEDLEAARTAATESAGRQEDLSRTADSLRAELAEVQSQEQTARGQLEQLERQLHGLREAEPQSGPLGNADLDHLRAESRRLGIVTRNAELLRLFHDVKKGAKSALTVLLLGEPGTGKELFARAVHRLSPREGKTFIAVNMAAVSPELFESELFGHAKGSFTGAAADRRGYFELAHQGTIFLDEIGDLRLDHQSKLLRVLQEKSFYRVGATSPTTADVRVVAATNRDLQRGVSEGWFREDLYFRLKGLVFRLPALRERPGDIPLLTEAVLAEIAQESGKPAPGITNETLHLLQGYHWPGNVRELRQVLERAVTLNDGPVLTKQSIALESRQTVQQERGGTVFLPDPAGDAAVLECLRRQGFDMQATAKALGWDRSTVTQRLKGLCFQALGEAGGDHAKAASTIAGDAVHLRTVELKLRDYYTHLLSVIEPFASADEALLECRRRFKNLPDRHFQSVETLVRRRFAHHDRSKTAPQS